MYKTSYKRKIGPHLLQMKTEKKMNSIKGFDVMEAYLCKNAIMKIVSQEILREIYRQPSGRATKKSMPNLDFHAKNFISKSPFLILSSSNKKGEMDTSPRGGAGGFVKVIGDNQIVIPDSKGNNRLDSLTNIIDTGRVSSLFLLPGIDETLRLNGSAFISTDHKLLDLFVDEKNIPASCIVIEVEEVFLHCAKALMRSKLWSTETQTNPKEFPTMGQMLKDQLQSPDEAETREDMIKRYTPDL
ncbi:MAG: PPOX class probable FMN-dependent enzyme [Glaciecola sp.]|jgi:PPOX class probable FMN-dependent enzyme